MSMQEAHGTIRRMAAPIRNTVWGFAALAAFSMAAATTNAQAPLVPPAQPRPEVGVPAKPAEHKPERSRHRRTKRVTRQQPHWGYFAARPAVTSAPFYAPPGIWPSATGHPSRPVVSPMWSLNTIRNPSYSPYSPGRPIAAPMAAMTLLTPHYVVRISPTARWMGAGYLRTASKQSETKK